LQRLVRSAAEALPQAPPAVTSDENSTPPVAQWLPNTRHPEQLFRAYRSDFAQLTASARSQTFLDLQWLRPPSGLRERDFSSAVTASLLQAPLITTILRFGEEPRRFGEVRRLMARLLAANGISRDETEAWQTTLRWLLYFLPNRIEARSRAFSEVFRTHRGQ